MIGVSGNSESKQFIESIHCKLDSKELTHSFLYIPECPLPLLGRCLLYKLGATIYLNENIMRVNVPFEKG